MKQIYRIFSSLAVLALAATSPVMIASAGGDAVIDRAIDDGLVGERIDGYLGIVDRRADASLIRRVNDINNRRRAVYAQLAQNTSTTTAQVARISGEKQTATSPRGSFIMDQSGRWTQK